MPDLRRDPIVGRWVIISTERNGRPQDFAQMQPIRHISMALCPFCPGQERLTPKEIMAYRPQPAEADAAVSSSATSREFALYLMRID